MGKWSEWCFFKGIPLTYWWMMPVCGFLAEGRHNPLIAVISMWALGPLVFWIAIYMFGGLIAAFLD